MSSNIKTEKKQEEPNLSERTPNLKESTPKLIQIKSSLFDDTPGLYESNYRPASILLALALLICFFQMPIVHRRSIRDGSITAPQAGIDLVSGLTTSDSVPTLKILSPGESVVVPDLTREMFDLANPWFQLMMYTVILNFFVCILSKHAGLVHMLLPLLALACIGIFALQAGNTDYVARIRSQGIVLEYRIITILIMSLLAVGSFVVGLLSVKRKYHMPIKTFLREQTIPTVVLLGSWFVSVVLFELDMSQFLRRVSIPSVFLAMGLAIASIVVGVCLKKRYPVIKGLLTSLGLTIFLSWWLILFLEFYATVVQYQCNAPLYVP